MTDQPTAPSTIQAHVRNGARLPAGEVSASNYVGDPHAGEFIDWGSAFMQKGLSAPVEAAPDGTPTEIFGKSTGVGKPARAPLMPPEMSAKYDSRVPDGSGDGTGVPYMVGITGDSPYQGSHAGQQPNHTPSGGPAPAGTPPAAKMGEWIDFDGRNPMPFAAQLAPVFAQMRGSGRQGPSGEAHAKPTVPPTTQQHYPPPPSRPLEGMMGDWESSLHALMSDLGVESMMYGFASDDGASAVGGRGTGRRPFTYGEDDEQPPQPTASAPPQEPPAQKSLGDFDTLLKALEDLVDEPLQKGGGSHKYLTRKRGASGWVYTYAHEGEHVPHPAKLESADDHVAHVMHKIGPKHGEHIEARVTEPNEHGHQKIEVHAGGQWSRTYGHTKDWGPSMHSMAQGRATHAREADNKFSDAMYSSSDKHGKAVAPKGAGSSKKKPAKQAAPQKGEQMSLFDGGSSAAKEPEKSGDKILGHTKSGKPVPHVPEALGEHEKASSAATAQHGLFDERAQPAISRAAAESKKHFESYSKDFDEQDHRDAAKLIDDHRWGDGASYQPHHRFAHNGIRNLHDKAADTAKKQSVKQAQDTHDEHPVDQAKRASKRTSVAGAGDYERPSDGEDHGPGLKFAPKAKPKPSDDPGMKKPWAGSGDSSRSGPGGLPTFRDSPPSTYWTPKGRTEKSMTRTRDIYGRMEKGSVYNFRDSSFSGEKVAEVPERYLYDYLCAFIEEAYEVESREPAHSKLDAREQLPSMARAIMHELVQALPKSKNLMRAAKKYNVTKASIQQILVAKGIYKPRTDAMFTDDGVGAMGGHLLAQNEPMAFSVPPSGWFKTEPAPVVLREIVDHTQLAPIVPIGDGVDPHTLIAKSQAARMRSFWPDAANPIAQPAPDCPVHNHVDLTKSQNLWNPMLPCRCSARG